MRIVTDGTRRSRYRGVGDGRGRRLFVELLERLLVLFEQLLVVFEGILQFVVFVVVQFNVVVELVIPIELVIRELVLFEFEFESRLQ